MGDTGTRGGGGFDWEHAEDLTALSRGELRARLGALAEEERAVTYEQAVLRGRMDVIRAELVRRGGVALSPEELARVLIGDEVLPGGGS